MSNKIGRPNLEVFAETLLIEAKKNPNIMVTTSDSRGSGKLVLYGKELPKQIIEVGIAEQNLVGVSAGLSAAGKKVFAVSPASFLTARSLEQIKADLENLGIPVRPAKMTISLVLRAKEMIVLGSGMGVQSLGFIDGRKIGSPRGKLYQVAMSCWLEKLSSSWQSVEHFR